MKRTQRLSRRQMLGTLALVSLGGVSKTPGFNSRSDSVSAMESRTLKINAKPEAVTVDLAKTVMIVVDMQNDFASKGGMFDLAGIDISMIQKVVGPTQKALAAARRAKLKIIYLRMGFRADLSDWGAIDSLARTRGGKRMGTGRVIQAPDGTQGRILIRDTWNTEIVSELKPQPGDVVIYKTRFSGFYKTNLDRILKNLGARHLIFTGCTTSVCVDSTIRDATFRDYQPVLLEDCTAEPIGHGLARSNHEATLLTIQINFGWVSNSDEFIQALAAP